MKSATYSAFSGLKNTVTEERLTASELAAAVNVDIDDAGQIHRRRGYTQAATGDYHSLYDSEAYLLVVKDGMLGVLREDFTHTPLVAVGPDRLAYATVSGDTYFSSRVTSGVIRGGTAAALWGEADASGTWVSPVVNPTATLTAVRGKLLSNPPTASALVSYKGRIYLAAGKVLWATELYLYSAVDKTKNFMQFEDDIQFLGAVSDGLYVGTTSAVYFLQGVFGSMLLTKVMDSGGVRNSLVTVPTDSVAEAPAHTKNAVMFMTELGLCVGFDSGVSRNLTQSKYIFPDSDRLESAMFRRQDGLNQYVGVSNSSGTPAQSARFGDYVDAEIRRFKGA